MSYKRILSFIFNGLISLLILCVSIYIVYTITGRFYDIGKKMALDYTQERPEQEIKVTINDGSSLAEVAEKLEDEGVISSAILFRLEHELKGNKGPFDGGSFILNTGMDATDIVYALREKIVYTTDIVITIREGYTVKDISEYLESKELFPAEDFIDACNNAEFDYAFIENIPSRENRLEGYLFPDTYYIAPGSTPETVINKLLTRFDDIYSNYSDKADEMGLTMDEVITIASIIEKEIRRDDERALAAEVIYNRLDEGSPLQMCSTILYALDKKKDRLYDEDLKVKSPYNTYINTGLPVGPISNPGEACIKAALNPGGGDMLYFVVKDEETGEHVFTNDYNKFLEAKALYNQKY